MKQIDSPAAFESAVTRVVEHVASGPLGQQCILFAGVTLLGLSIGGAPRGKIVSGVARTFVRPGVGLKIGSLDDPSLFHVWSRIESLDFDYCVTHARRLLPNNVALHDSPVIHEIGTVQATAAIASAMAIAQGLNRDVNKLMTKAFGVSLHEVLDAGFRNAGLAGSRKDYRMQ